MGYINMAEAQKKKTTDAMQVKLVFHGPGGRRVEVRRFEVEGKPTITSIKDKVAELRPQMSVFTLGWRDEEDDMVVVETEEELGIALKQMAGDLLSIHVMDKMVDGDAEKAARVGQRSMIRMPEEYKVQVKELERRLVEQEVAVAVNVLSKEELIAAVKKQPGVLFVRGLGIEGEKPGNENNANVWRIMEARSARDVQGGRGGLALRPHKVGGGGVDGSAGDQQLEEHRGTDHCGVQEKRRESDNFGSRAEEETKRRGGQEEVEGRDGPWQDGG